MSLILRRSAGLGGSVVILAVLVWRLGTGPFLNGLRMLDAGALAAAAGIGLLSTVCCAWRWKMVARGLGAKLSLGGAIAAYYRSQFLNVALPGGVIGDVHRGLSHGRALSDVGRALRAVVLERLAGQVVQLLLTVAILTALPSPVGSAMPLVWIAMTVALLGLALVVRVRIRGGHSPRFLGAAARDVRDGLLRRRAWVGIALVSAVVVGAHAVTFLIAARTAGATASAPVMLPLALLAMSAMVLPSASGWGPREGVTAWAFGAAGLGAGRGVATGVVYGVMVLVACLPGAAVLVVTWFRGTRLPRSPRARFRERAAHA
jgi:uncharacterized membrane protein YbhN (UPF0104 family)